MRDSRKINRSPAATTAQANETPANVRVERKKLTERYASLLNFPHSYLATRLLPSATALVFAGVQNCIRMYLQANPS